MNTKIHYTTQCAKIHNCRKHQLSLAYFPGLAKRERSTRHLRVICVRGNSMFDKDLGVSVLAIDALCTLFYVRTIIGKYYAHATYVQNLIISRTNHNQPYPSPQSSTSTHLDRFTTPPSTTAGRFASLFWLSCEVYLQVFAVTSGDRPVEYLTHSS